MLDYGWWDANGRANQRAVKAKLTRAERRVQADPEYALGVCAEVREVFDAHGWPDWWSRVDRLEWDAESARMHR